MSHLPRQAPIIAPAPKNATREELVAWLASLTPESKWPGGSWQPYTNRWGMRQERYHTSDGDYTGFWRTVPVRDDEEPTVLVGEGD